MVALNDFKISRIVEKDGSTKFTMGPLQKGYGHTLGNFLRRILLSSIPGSAITSVKIDGVQHEYSTLNGLPDDILAVLLSIKNIVVASKVLEPVTLKIEVKGKEGQIIEVKAGDIEKSSKVDIVNPDYVITKLTSGKAKFSAEFTVERGMGYAQLKDELRKELTLLPLDASFSPVTLVNYVITTARVGKETDLDQLELLVKTNGSITPEEALNIACNTINIMTEHLHTLSSEMLKGDEINVKLHQEELENSTKEESVVEVVVDKQPILVSDLNLSTRLTNALLKSGYDDLRKLENMTEEELSNIRGMGNKSFVELVEILKKYNVKII